MLRLEQKKLGDNERKKNSNKAQAKNTHTHSLDVRMHSGAFVCIESDRDMSDLFVLVRLSRVTGSTHTYNRDYLLLPQLRTFIANIFHMKQCKPSLLL